MFKERKYYTFKDETLETNFFLTNITYEIESFPIWKEKVEKSISYQADIVINEEKFKSHAKKEIEKYPETTLLCPYLNLTFDLNQIIENRVLESRIKILLFFLGEDMYFGFETFDENFLLETYHKIEEEQFKDILKELIKLLLKNESIRLRMVNDREFLKYRNHIEDIL